MWSAPEAARWALTFGQPSRGLTMRSRVSPKLPIARAAMPMFSPSCGSTRITTGPASVTPDLVLSVPEPDISLSLSGSTSEGFERGFEEPPLTPLQPATGLPVRQNFSSQITELVARTNSPPKPPSGFGTTSLARIRLSDRLSITLKANPKARFKGDGKLGGV